MTTDATRAVYLTQTCSVYRLERECIQLLWIDDARCGLADIAEGRTHDADDAIAKIQQRRALEVQELTNK